MRRYPLFTKMCFAHYDVYIPFICRKCGKRCRTFTPRFSDNNLEKIAMYLHKPLDKIRKDYAVHHKTRSLTNSLPCPFFNDGTNECSIYPLRPDCCRLYPFSFGGGHMACPEYRHHLTIVDTIAHQEQLLETYDSSFCPDGGQRPIPEHIWPEILHKFMQTEPSHAMIWNFIKMNKIWKGTFRTSSMHSH
jgi:Fe-S-cluster containining protein